MQMRNRYVVIADHIVWFSVRGERFARDPGAEVLLTEAEARDYVHNRLIKRED